MKQLPVIQRRRKGGVNFVMFGRTDHRTATTRMATVVGWRVRVRECVCVYVRVCMRACVCACVMCLQSSVKAQRPADS